MKEWQTRSETIKAMYAEGKSLREIAAHYGRSIQYPKRILERIGVPIRPPHGHEFHKQYRGGRVEAGQGYWKQKIAEDDPMASMRDKRHGYVKEHRLVMARSLGRPLRDTETVHHINGDRSDNRLENLQLRQGKHGKHAAMRCNACGSHDVSPARLE